MDDRGQLSHVLPAVQTRDVKGALLGQGRMAFVQDCCNLPERQREGKRRGRRMMPGLPRHVQGLGRTEVTHEGSSSKCLLRMWMHV